MCCGYEFCLFLRFFYILFFFQYLNLQKEPLFPMWRDIQRMNIQIQMPTLLLDVHTCIKRMYVSVNLQKETKNTLIVQWITKEHTLWFNQVISTCSSPLTSPMEWVSEWLLLSANSALFQLYHGENKLAVNEMMIRFAKCTRPIR